MQKEIEPISILVVEPDDDTTVIVKALLEPLGAVSEGCIITQSSFTEAKKILTNPKVKLGAIILNVDKSEEEAFTLIKEMRLPESPFVKVPILTFSLLGDGSQETRIKSMNLPNVQFITSPELYPQMQQQVAIIFNLTPNDRRNT